MQQCHEQISYQGDPNLDFDGVAALAVEVSEWEILLYLLEESLYLPSAAINKDYILHRHVKVVGEQLYELWLLAFLYVHICDNPGNMVNLAFAEHCHLFPVLHLA